MKHAKEWFETFDERLWLKGDEGAEREAEFVRKVLELRRGARVLDAPCGAGRIAIHLARAGCRVTGVDITGRFIRRARRRFARSGLKGTFLVCDLRQLDFEGGFDGVYNWWGSFGYFSDPENLDLLRRFARAVEPGGRVLIDQPNREFILRHWLQRKEDGHLAVKNAWDAETERAKTTWALSCEGRRAVSHSSMRLYTAGQFASLFRRAGLEVEAMYGDLDGGEYRRGSRRIYVVGRKRRGGKHV
jgi:SAM-dependent methyltransferase